MEYCFSKQLNMDFEQAVLNVTEGLKKEGFGILTEIDVKATQKGYRSVVVGAFFSGEAASGHLSRDPSWPMDY